MVLGSCSKGEFLRPEGQEDSSRLIGHWQNHDGFGFQSIEEPPSPGLRRFEVRRQPIIKQNKKRYKYTRNLHGSFDSLRDNLSVSEIVPQRSALSSNGFQFKSQEVTGIHIPFGLGSTNWFDSLADAYASFNELFDQLPFSKSYFETTCPSSFQVVSIPSIKSSLKFAS